MTTNQTALITGASRGLGLALARQLAQQGWTLILNARGAEALTAAAAELATWTTVTAVAGDVADPDHQQVLAQAVAALVGVDVVINNASILGPSPQPKLLDYPIDALINVYQINVIAPLALLQALRPYLSANTRIINITSDAAVEAYPGWGGYGSSKAALEQLTAVFAAENPNFHVYSVDPGEMRTQMHQEAFPGEDISDRPWPEERVPGIVALINGSLSNGRYQAQMIPSNNQPATEVF